MIINTVILWMTMTMTLMMIMTMMISLHNNDDDKTREEWESKQTLEGLQYWLEIIF